MRDHLRFGPLRLLIVALVGLGSSAGCAAGQLDTYERGLLGGEQALKVSLDLVVKADKTYQHSVADVAVTPDDKAAALVKLKVYEQRRDAVVLPMLDGISVAVAAAHASLAAGRMLASVPADLPGEIAKLAALLIRLGSAIPSLANPPPTSTITGGVR